MELSQNSLNKTARFTGLLYLIWTLTAIYGLIYVQPLTIVPSDPLATSNKILANEFLFRTGIVNSLFSSTIWLLIGLTLYPLFKNVNEDLAKLLIAFVVVQIPLVFLRRHLVLLL